MLYRVSFKSDSSSQKHQALKRKTTMPMNSNKNFCSWLITWKMKKTLTSLPNSKTSCPVLRQNWWKWESKWTKWSRRKKQKKVRKKTLTLPPKQKIRIKLKWTTKSAKLSSGRSRTLNGMMLEDWIKQKKYCKKPLFYLSNSLKFLLEKEHHGKESCSMALLGQEKLFLQRHVLRKWKEEHFSVFQLLI